jgi:hypothetical protein
VVALATVERVYDRRRPDDDPTWVYWLDSNEITVMAGRCWVELGLPDRATPLLDAAVARCDENHAREAALYRSWLAEAYLQRGDLDHALSEAAHVIDLERRAGSQRASDRVRYLRTQFDNHGDRHTVRTFDDLHRS